MEGVPDQSGLDAGVQLRVDGQEVPLEAGQQSGQPFQIEPPLQCPPQMAPYIGWFVQQRGYVAEMVRREQEVVQRQLADMHRQQLDFMVKQEYLMRNILAALNASEQNPGTRNNRRCGSLGREENITNGESEVSFGVSGRKVNAHSILGRQEPELVAINQASTRLQHCFGSKFTKASTEITLYNESPTMSRAANGPKEDPRKVVPVDKNVFVNSKSPASGSPRLQCAEPTSPMLTGLECHQYTPTVNKPERSPVAQQEHLSPQEKASTGMSQPLAGPKCTSGSDDDFEGSREELEKEAQAGRNTKIQALDAVLNDGRVLKAFGSTPSQVVWCAPPTETEFERIRTKLEFDPPPSSSSLFALTNVRTDRSDSRSREFGIKKRHREPGAASKCVVGVMFTDEFQLGGSKSHSPADWDPGPDVAVMSLVLVGILQERQQPGKASANSGAATPTFWMFSQHLGSLEQQSVIGVLWHNSPPVGSSSPSSTSTSSLQSASSGSGRASSVQAPCWSSRSRRSPQWSDLYLYLLY